jgi:hypothetical protein
MSPAVRRPEGPTRILVRSNAIRHYGAPYRNARLYWNELVSRKWDRKSFHGIIRFSATNVPLKGVPAAPAQQSHPSQNAVLAMAHHFAVIFGSSDSLRLPGNCAACARAKKDLSVCGCVALTGGASICLDRYGLRPHSYCGAK